MTASSAITDPSATDARVLERLRAACAGRGSQCAPRLGFGCEAIDRSLGQGGLLVGAVHEFFGSGRPGQRRFWTPPLSVVLHLAERAGASKPQGLVLWIGERIWPFPTPLFGGGSRLGARSIFVRAARAEERVWATDLALRSGASAAVLADGSGMDLSSTRRLQLAAEAGGCVCLLARPPWEREALSAATTRWSVAPAGAAGLAARGGEGATCGSTRERRWIVELLRRKGLRPAGAATSRWSVERDRATCHGLVAAELLDRPCEAEAAPARLLG